MPVSTGPLADEEELLEALLDAADEAALLEALLEAAAEDAALLEALLEAAAEEAAADEAALLEALLEAAEELDDEVLVPHAAAVSVAPPLPTPAYEASLSFTHCAETGSYV